MERREHEGRWLLDNTILEISMRSTLFEEKTIKVLT